ncbi:DUF1592 domain-containing protein [Thalassoglobus sp. JC818]|uniref:DUF1592 domain-containing protein n=1 Tax=Thalassoglobus sp. JC818 TaxID=3232136 RepID=UPI003457AE26
MKQYCIRCHGAEDDVYGEVNFLEIQSPAKLDEAFEIWERAAELVVDGSMPPEDELQPTPMQREQFKHWYQKRFVESVQPHPGYLRPRRLSVVEYRNTLQSLLGFELDVVIREAEQTVSETSLVLKLLPIDPPGPSRFKNDTSANPLTTLAWNQYSYIIDNALERLFSPQYQSELEAFTGPIDGDFLTEQQAKRMLRTLIPRAYRRTVDDSVVSRSVSEVTGYQGSDLEIRLRREIKTILMSPQFLFRGLLLDVPRDQRVPVDDFELAERLSYFLWADMPDQELLNLAAEGQLGQADVYHAQIDRMLASPKARSLAEDFGVQWFSLSEIEHVSNNPPVADALFTQAVDFLDYLFRHDRPLTELIDSDVSFINPHTAKYYPNDRVQMAKYSKQKGIEVERVPNQQITLNNTMERGGLLTMPGVLAMNKGPIQRGTWILERVLGEHLPDPPADVGQVAASPPGEELTFRQRFEQHRSNATCAVCHDKIDPLGFSLQEYDDNGEFIAQARESTRKKKKQSEWVELDLPIDSSGQLSSGERFDDFNGLKRLLVTTQRERVTHNIVETMMAYGLCRKLEAYDRAAIERIVEELDENHGTFRDLIHKIADSLPFKETVVLGNE